MTDTLASLEPTIRYLLGDFSHSMVPGDIFVYENSSVFTLSEANPIDVTEVIKNSTALTSGQYSFDATTNKVTVTASLSAGDTVEIQYTYYPNYSSTEIQSYIQAAIVHLSVNNFYDFEVENDTIYPEMSKQERNLLALVTATLIEPDNKSYRLPDLSINVPPDLPLNDKISKIIAVAKRNTHGTFDLVETN